MNDPDFATWDPASLRMVLPAYEQTLRDVQRKIDTIRLIISLDESTERE